MRALLLSILLIVQGATVTGPMKLVGPQAVVPGTGGGGGGTWTHTQASIIGRAVRGTNLSISTNTWTLTFDGTANKPGSALGTGNAVIVSVYDSNGTLLSSVNTGSCTGSWTVPAGQELSTGPVGGVSSAHCENTANVTAITGTMAASIVGDDLVVAVEEGTCSTTIGTVVAPNGVNTTPAQANPPGIGGTISGNNFAVQFMVPDTGQATAISGSYNINVNDSNAVSLGFPADAWKINETAGTAPTWTSVSATSISNGTFIKCN